MINKKKILGIITARSGSKGLKNKNILKVNNRPLLYWPIKAFKGSQYIDNFIISTDSKKYQKISKKYGCEAPFLRPKNIAKDNTMSFEVIKHAINFFKKKKIFYDYFVLLEPTSPLTDSKDVDACIKKLIYNKKAKALVSVSKNINMHPEYNYEVDKKKFLKIKKNFIPRRRQKLNNFYFLDGSIYISEINSYLKKKTFYHSQTLANIMPKIKSFEIDDYIDLVCVNSLMKEKKNIK